MKYVIQKHKSSHLHYDLRLEMRRRVKDPEQKPYTLRSWAIPKEPLSDGTMRLAIETTWHHIDYASFHGVIEEGYGAGTVRIWDKGTYALLHKARDKILINIRGKKLNGIFQLLKIKGEKNNWLFYKVEQSRPSGAEEYNKRFIRKTMEKIK